MCLFSRGQTRLWTVNVIIIASISGRDSSNPFAFLSTVFFFFSRKHNPAVATFQTQQEVGKLIAAQASALMKDYLQRGNGLIELKGNFLLICTPVMARAMQGGRKESQKASGRRWRQQDLLGAPPPWARARVSAGCGVREAAHLRDLMNLSPILEDRGLVK